MKHIRILIIYPIDHLGSKIGGIEGAIRESIKYAASDFEIEIVGISLENGGLRIGEWNNVIFESRKIKFFPVFQVKDPNRHFRIPLILCFTLALLRWRHKINFKKRLIIFHRLEPAYVLRDIKEKKILFVHGDIRYFKNEYCESRWKKFRKLYYFLEPFFIKQMKGVFIGSQKGCKYYKSKYPKYSARFKFFPTWYDSQVFYRMKDIDNLKILQSYGIPDKKSIILFVGRLELAKDPILLINSFSFVTKRHSDSHLIVVGEGQLKRKMIQQISDLDLVEKVTFLDQKLPSEIAQLMNISDLLLLTSAFESMSSRVVLEALACGLPVVATNVGDVHLVVKNGISGKIVRERNAKKIGDAVLEILRNRDRFVAENCIKAIEPYTAKKVLEKVYFFHYQLLPKNS